MIKMLAFITIMVTSKLSKINQLKILIIKNHIFVYMEKRYFSTLFVVLVTAACAFAQSNKSPLSITDTVTISFIGDVMQHGGQISAALSKGEGKTYNYENAFRRLSGRFRQADLMVANMEFTLGTRPYSGYPTFSAPPEIAYAAKDAGIGLFMLANNHIADKGKTGFENTFKAYEEIGVPTIGVYRTSDEEMKNDPMIVTIKGIKFAFFNYTYDTNGMPVTPPYHVNLQDSTYIREVIAKARLSKADIIIALPHWGEEYHLSPSQEQKEYAEFMFNEGVDVIIGSHPHVPEEAYIYTESSSATAPLTESEPAVKRVVFYSLGNYISNQSDPAYTQVGTFVRLRFIKNLLSGKISLAMPEWEYTWCFRKGELESDYTVVPIEEFINGETYQKGGETPTHKAAFDLMSKTYGLIKDKQLVKVITE